MMIETDTPPPDARNPAAGQQTLFLQRLWAIETSFSCPPNLLGLSRAVGFAIVFILGTTAYLVGSTFFHARLDRANFYQNSFSPAVVFACTGQFHNIIATGTAAAFLSDKTGRLETCNGVSSAEKRPFLIFHSGIAYLQLTAGFIWRILGISWSHLSIIAGLLVSIYSVSTYAFVRAFTPSRLLSATMAIATITATPAIAQIANLRDYSKAPFIAAALAALAIGCLRSRSQIARSALFATAGAITAIGLGFRSDIQMIWPIAAISAFFTWNSKEPIARNIWHISALLLLFSISYALLRTPHWYLFEEIGKATTNTGHVFSLGFADPFFLNLGMTKNSYGQIAFYKDEYLYGIVNLFSSHAERLQLVSSEYYQESLSLFNSIVALTPHDFLMRAIYSLTNFVKFPINNVAFGIALVAAIPVCWISDRRKFLYLSSLMTISAGVLSLQFHERHAFFVSIFGAAAISLTAASLWRILATKYFSRNSFQSICIDAISLAVLLVALVAFSLIVTNFTLKRQTEALSSTAGAYHQLAWSSAAFSMKESAFVLEDASELHSELMARVTVHRNDNWKEQPHLPIDLDWKVRPGNTLARDEQRTSVRAKQRGYVAWTTARNPGSLLSHRRTDNASRDLIISFSYDSDSDLEFALWINRNRLENRTPLLKGTEMQVVQYVSIPQDATSVSFLINNPNDNSAAITVMDFAIRDAQGLCPRTDTTISARYRFGTSSPSMVALNISPETYTAAYYFPAIFQPYASIHSVKVTRTDRSCVTWELARVATSPLPPIELLLEDGLVRSTERGTWGGLLQRYMWLLSH